MNQIRKRLTYANVMSSIAVFLVIGGATAFAALGKNTVGSKQLKKNAVTTAKIKNGAVTGAKVNVSGFPKVPSATNADNATNAGHATSADSAKAADSAKSASFASHAGDADTVAGGITVREINYVASPVDGPEEILNLDGFTLTASCKAGDELVVLANGPSGSRLQSSGQDSSSPSSNKDALFTDSLTPTSEINLLPEDDDLITGQTEFSLGEDELAVTVNWEAEGFTASSGPHCTFTGYAIG
ncbi:MAG TPA: hypothetical protein VFL77_10485 [Solirubrobacterales bacterium]|nr:hypothetical protein [Solirubrobacterales bacterium]